MRTPANVSDFDASGTGSVSAWIRDMKNGRDSAAGYIFDRYKNRLDVIASNLLPGWSRAVSDEEDVVLTAFYSFLRRTRAGAYPDLRTRDDLWRLLVRITRTHAWKHNRFFMRIKRFNSCEADTTAILGQLASSTPPPDVLASVGETLSDLLGRLGDSDLKQIAIARLKGLTNQEIAKQHNCSVRTIERRLRVIRSAWSESVPCVAESHTN